MISFFLSYYCRKVKVFEGDLQKKVLLEAMKFFQVKKNLYLRR